MCITFFEKLADHMGICKPSSEDLLPFVEGGCCLMHGAYCG